MNLYQSKTYRQALKLLVETRKKETRGLWNAQRLADAMAVHKSYLSAVFSERSHLSSDQIFLAAKALNLNSRETSFLNLLLEWERSAVEERRKELLSKIEGFRIQAESVHSKLSKLKLIESAADLSRYYVDPFHQVVHIALSIPRYAKDTGLLARDLRISTTRLAQILVSLVDMGLAEADGKNRYKFKGRNLHLPSDNPLFRGYQRGLRQALIERLGESSDELSFSAFFSVDAKSYARIRERWLECIKDLQIEVSRAPSEQLFQINLDLVPWSQ